MGYDVAQSDIKFTSTAMQRKDRCAPAQAQQQALILYPMLTYYEL